MNSLITKRVTHDIQDIGDINNNLLGKNKPIRLFIKARYVIASIVLLFIFLTFIRAPYIGSYPDAIFDYVFGTTKYFVYILTMALSITALCSANYFEYLTSKRMILTYVILYLSLGLIISFFHEVLNYHLHDEFTLPKIISEYNNYWVDYLHQKDYSIFVNPYYSGGILILILSSLFSYIILALILTIALAMLIYAMISLFVPNKRANFALLLKLKKFIINKLGGAFEFEKTDELKPKIRDRKIIKATNKQVCENASSNSQAHPSISLLSDTTQDNHQFNQKFAEQVANLLVETLNKNDIIINEPTVTIAPLYSVIKFEYTDDFMMEQIIKLETQIKKATGLEKYIISYKGTIASLEFKNKKPSKIGFKRALETSVQSLEKGEIIFALDEKFEGFKFNIFDLNNILIIGKKGSGSTVVLSNILMCGGYLNNPDELEVEIYSIYTNSSISIFETMVHTTTYVEVNFEKIIHKLHILNDDINIRITELNNNGFENFEQYELNKPEDLTFKRKVVAISCFDSLLRDSYQNQELLTNILSNSKKAGVSIILTANNVNNDSLNPKLINYINARFVLQLENEFESVRLFDDYRANKICGPGDILFDNNGKGIKARLQSCYLNEKELQYNIDLINTFYEAKRKLHVSDDVNIEDEYNIDITDQQEQLEDDNQTDFIEDLLNKEEW